MKRYKMTITILSPIHIGTGEDLEPLEYMVKDRLFYRLNLTDFLQSLPEDLKTQFYRATDSSNPVLLRKFIAQHIDLKKYTLFTADACDAFIQAYERNLNNPKNQLLVNLMTRTGADYCPYLPGSSIKGAIRTAIISCLLQHKNIHSPDIKNFEKQVLGHSNARQDPFRCLKIADAPLPDNATFIDKVEIFNPQARVTTGPSGIQMFYEQCFSLLDEQNITASTTLVIDDKLPAKTYFNQRTERNENAVSLRLSHQLIIESCKKFYLPKIESEHNKFYKASKELDQCNKPLLEVNFADNEFPIRVGRFSHIECVTVDGLRKPMGAAARRGWGKTRTLSAGKMAMGWVKVTVRPVT